MQTTETIALLTYSDPMKKRSRKRILKAKSVQHILKKAIIFTSSFPLIFFVSNQHTRVLLTFLDKVANIEERKKKM